MTAVSNYDPSNDILMVGLLDYKKGTWAIFEMNTAVPRFTLKIWYHLSLQAFRNFLDSALQNPFNPITTMYLLNTMLSLLALSFLVSLPTISPTSFSSHLTSSTVPCQPSQTSHQCNHSHLSKRNRTPQLPCPKIPCTISHRKSVFLSGTGVLSCADRINSWLSPTPYHHTSTLVEAWEAGGLRACPLEYGSVL